MYIVIGTSLVVQWLRLCASSAGSMGSIPGQGTKIPHAMWRGKKKEKGKKKTSVVLPTRLPIFPHL